LRTLQERRAEITETDEVNYHIISYLMTFSLTHLLALVILFGGIYGDNLSFLQNFTIYIQFFFVGIALGLLNWLFKKKIGIGSLTIWMVISSVSFSIFDGMFSLSPDPFGGFPWYRGCVIAFFQGLFKDPIDVETPFSRVGRTPDMIGLMATIVVFAAVIYVSSITINFPSNTKQKKQNTGIFHNLEKPLLLTSVFFSLIYLTSNLMYNNWKASIGFPPSL